MNSDIVPLHNISSAILESWVHLWLRWHDQLRYNDSRHETLAMTRKDSDSRLMTRDSTHDSAPGKSNDLRLDSRLGTSDSGLADSRQDSHDSCTALRHTQWWDCDDHLIAVTISRHSQCCDCDDYLTVVTISWHDTQWWDCDDHLTVVTISRHSQCCDCDNYLTVVTMNWYTQWWDCDDFNTMKLIKKQFVIDAKYLFCCVQLTYRIFIFEDSIIWVYLQ